MEKICQEESGASSAGVFELSGEPAVVINGVPNVGCRDNAFLQFDTPSHNVESTQNTGFGEWLEGREVQKMFGEMFYNGTVTNFDRETGWYRVVYEDGDSEDLEWHELEEVLVPLEISVPLKTLALKILKKCEKPSHKSVKHVARSQNPRGKNVEF
ncbi:hypothetical protein NE237_008657 [Protea cynaroides]|uniref:PTM/DIR17-like Tudor domain-containing protein n=1 Tax=Protea cynaroides TaxID=273540 RepID=A0A9Q0QZW4_9MAGN|nr:hypothetical protein NE237_008657 [Protea cynaroides]